MPLKRDPQQFGDPVATGFAAYTMLQSFVNGLPPGDVFEAVWKFTADGDAYYSLCSQQQTVGDAGVAQFVMPLDFLNREHEAGTVEHWVEVPTPTYDGPPIMTGTGPAYTVFRLP